MWTQIMHCWLTGVLISFCHIAYSCTCSCASILKTDHYSFQIVLYSSVWLIILRSFYLITSQMSWLVIIWRKMFCLILQLVARLTKDIIETYQICNPQFKYSEELNPKRYLTSPSIGVLNDGHDNVNSDLILTVNYVLINLDTQRRFVIAFILPFLEERRGLGSLISRSCIVAYVNFFNLY